MNNGEKRSKKLLSSSYGSVNKQELVSVYIYSSLQASVFELQEQLLYKIQSLNKLLAYTRLFEKRQKPTVNITG